MRILEYPPCKHGHPPGRYKNRRCIECAKMDSASDKGRESRRKSFQRHYAVYKDAINVKTKMRRTTPRGKATQLLSNARLRARKRGLSFSLSVEWVCSKLESGVCELTGLPLDLHVTKLGGARSPSIDRIDSSKGYDQENCRIIFQSLNIAFSWWGEEEFRPIAAKWLAQSEALCERMG